jgi:hypothetical protein
VLGRTLAWALRLPTAGESVATQVVISRDGAQERWRRCFAGVELRSVQRAGAGGLLLEQVGPLELRLRLAAEDGALVYRQVGQALVVARWRLGLPDWLSPRVSAREAAADQPACTQLAVQLALPWGALLLSYEGVVRHGEVAP